MTTRRYGKRRLVARAQRAVHLRQAACAEQAHALVPALHLPDDVRQRCGRLLGARHDGRQEVRDRLVVAELDALRVDEDHPHLVRGRAAEDRRQDRVDAAGLAGARRAGDQQVRHAREVGPDRVARDVLAEPDGERARGLREVVEHVAERDEVRRDVRHLDADGLLPGIGARIRISVVASA